MNIYFRNIVFCTKEQQEKVLTIRNSPIVKGKMYTDSIISIKDHLRWIDYLKNNLKQLVFAIIDSKGNILGIVSLNNIDYLNKRTDWAFYLSKEKKIGLAVAIEFKILNYIFEILNIEKLNCEVLENNLGVKKLHNKFGFVDEGFIRSNIIRNDKRIGVFLLGITKEEWFSKRNYFFEKYSKILSKFNIEVENEENYFN